jgi:hypothetical protein
MIYYRIFIHVFKHSIINLKNKFILNHNLTLFLIYHVIYNPLVAFLSIQIKYICLDY